MPGKPITELLNRNVQLFKGRRLLVVGELDDSALLPLLKDTQSATLLVDNYVSFQKMAALLGQTVSSAREQQCAYKQVKLYFSSLSACLPQLEPVDTLLLLLTKNKQASRLLLSSVQTVLEPAGTILLAGANAAGGRSADSLLKEAGAPYKVDSARKCTLFSLTSPGTFAPLKELPEVIFAELKLKQHPLVFSAGEVDAGTGLLLEALTEQELYGEILDLGCGCGIVGLSAAKHPQVEKLSFLDVSAQALELTAENIALNALRQPYELLASDMLQQAESYDAICVNPPFHQGIEQDNRATLAMFAKAPAHLKPQGCLYVVGNSFLHYEQALAAHFNSVEVLRKTSKFTVLRARL